MNPNTPRISSVVKNPKYNLKRILSVSIVFYLPWVEKMSHYFYVKSILRRLYRPLNSLSTKKIAEKFLKRRSRRSQKNGKSWAIRLLRIEVVRVKIKIIYNCRINVKYWFLKMTWILILGNGLNEHIELCFPIIFPVCFFIWCHGTCGLSKYLHNRKTLSSV